jgi:exonuclease SbcC
MKILAIRGKNLASLSAEFEIDFQAEPLASAGLYAITGATGAGKSTLLDALCLALYERTPRLVKATSKGESVPDVADNSITPSDPRTILRRGAAEGFAEVDFVGSDGVAYRSRWSVRRSRNKADGKLQNSDINLTRIHDGQALGDHRKTETLRLIESYIGLNFDQFTRAVLLAQNDFAAFLKATDDERAELLQTLTGTETFSQISKQAFARMKAENEKLELLQSRLKDQAPLLPEIRAEKELQRQEQTETVKVQSERKTIIEGHLRWHQQWDQLKVIQAAASQKLEAATIARDLATPRFAHLTRVEQVQAARPLWSELERLTLQISGTEKAQSDSQDALNAAMAGVVTHEVAHNAVVNQMSVAEIGRTNAQSDINNAKALDASIIVLTPQFEAARKAQEDANQHLQTQQSIKDAAGKRLTQSTSDLVAIDVWMAEHVQIKPLAEGWQLWETLFAQAQAHQKQLDKTILDIKDLTTTAGNITEAQASAHADMATADSKFSAAGQNLEALTQACAALDIDQLLRDSQRLEDRRDHLQSAAQLWQKRCDLQSQQVKLRQQQQAQELLRSSCNDELIEGAKAQPLLEQALTTAEQSLSVAKLAASKGAETLRTALQTDQPCPVCGSLEHPYATHSPVADAMLKSLQDQVKDKRKSLDELLQRLASTTTNKTNAEQQFGRLVKDLAQLDTDLAGLLAGWQTLVLRAEVDALPESDRTQWLVAQQVSNKDSLDQLNQQAKAHRSQIKLKDAAQVTLDLAKKVVDAARETIVQLEIKRSTTAQSMDAAQQQREQGLAQLHQVLAQLDGGFASPDWRKQWQQGADAFVTQCRSQANDWRERQQGKTTLSVDIASMQVEVSGYVNACHQATQQLGVQSDLRTTVETDLIKHRESRAALFGGRAVVDVEKDLNVAVDLARKAVVQAHEALLKAQGEVTRLQESVRLAGIQLAQYRQAHIVAGERLSTWLDQFNATSQSKPSASGQHSSVSTQALTMDELDTLLEIALQWQTDEREALQQLERSVGEAQAVLATRKESLAEHQAKRVESEDASVLQQTLTQILLELELANEVLSNLKLELLRDDDRLSTSESLRIAIEKQSGISKVWSQLSELIGSADGKKFRNFAQQYTLDILLGYGNSHLQSLSRRYRLQRIKDTLGLLVVDQDMGDEVRSVHSLSGGESFLVSLALALGLASLSSHRVKVESLFIDEGFGSLDAESLRVAMDALDNLQALGRKVGVISHVQEMTERIGTQVEVMRQAGGNSRIRIH